MNLQNYVGYPLAFVIEELNKQNLKYNIIDSNSEKLKYDTILVIKIEQLNNIINIITDKFMFEV